jgi:hypothetical protein
MRKVTRATLLLNSWPDAVCQGRHHSKQHCGDRQDGGKDEFAQDAPPLSMGRTAPALGRHLAAKGPNRQVGQLGAELTRRILLDAGFSLRRRHAHGDVLLDPLLLDGIGGPCPHRLLAARQESAIAFW